VATLQRRKEYSARFDRITPLTSSIPMMVFRRGIGLIAATRENPQPSNFGAADLLNPLAKKAFSLWRRKPCEIGLNRCAE
jgi:hypothetical protein